MLNAYNNDIEYKSRWFHIQTEDNGQRNGHITTTVFHNGQTLDCKSTSYLEHIDGVSDDEEIKRIVKERMVDQHQFFYKKLFDGDYDAKVEAMYAKSSIPKATSVINLAAKPSGSAHVMNSPLPVPTALPVPTTRTATLGKGASKPEVIRAAQPDAAPVAGSRHVPTSSVRSSVNPKIVRPASASIPRTPNLTKKLDRSQAVQAADAQKDLKPWAGVAWPKDDLALNVLVASLLDGQPV